LGCFVEVGKESEASLGFIQERGASFGAYSNTNPPHRRIAGDSKRYAWNMMIAEGARRKDGERKRAMQVGFLRRCVREMGKRGVGECWTRWRETTRWIREGQEGKDRAVQGIVRWTGVLKKKVLGRVWRWWGIRVEVEKERIRMLVEREVEDMMVLGPGGGDEDERAMKRARFKVAFSHVKSIVGRWEERALRRAFRRLVEVLGEWRTEKKIDVEYEYIRDIMKSYNRLQGNVEGSGVGGFGGFR